MHEDFAGRVALVTGAFRGFGLATAQRLAARGASVAVHVRDPERAKATARRLGDRGFAVSGDLGNPADLQSIVARTLDRFGRLDVLVNNAAVALTTRFEKITEEEWRRTFDVNVTAVFLLIRAVLPAMKEQGYGRIVNLSSTAGKDREHPGRRPLHVLESRPPGIDPRRGQRVGTLRHHRQRHLPRSLRHRAHARERHPEQLEAIAKTFPIRRLGDPVEVADLICFLASEAAGYVTGASLDINGGDLMV